MNKQITIIDGAYEHSQTKYVLNSAHDLYVLYTEWLATNDGVWYMSEEEVSLCEEIRERYDEVWASVAQGEYPLQQFEKLALEVLERKRLSEKDIQIFSNLVSKVTAKEITMEEYQVLCKVKEVLEDSQEKVDYDYGKTSEGIYEEILIKGQKDNEHTDTD